MAARKKTWYAILGLLSWKPMSGYDIKRFVAMGISHFWSESYGQLFPTLNRLTAEGLVTKEPHPLAGRRKRFLYTLTEKGSEALTEWLRAPAEPVPVRNELLLRFFLCGRRPVSDAIRVLTEYRRQIEDRLTDYAESEAALAAAARRGVLPAEVEVLLTERENAPPGRDRRQEALVFLLTLRHGIAVLRARLAWCEEAAAALRSAPLSHPKESDNR